MPTAKPIFTKRHYEMIAFALGKYPRYGTTEEFVRLFTKDNPQFKPNKFRQAVEKATEFWQSPA